MTDTAPIPAGSPCWVDLSSSDPEASKAFYGELLGWTFETGSEEFGGYITAFLEGKQVAGLMQSQEGAPANVWSVYLGVSDIEATNEAVTANGGTIALPPMTVGDLGAMGFVIDPSGGFVGEWQFGKHVGFEALDVPGAPAWFELHTRNYAAALPFYQKAFGWTTQVMGDTDEFRYSVLAVDEVQRAGVMDSDSFLPEGVPSNWIVYFNVADADAAVETIQRLGGAVLRGPEDTPYGRLASVSDSTGAMFSLLQHTS
ncbi:VOC family protein [Galbitalea soli]|uniref:VOC family protein n=1 Tax=Galbitalea soli TaxID=1268042 RepID=A0A7C9PMM6_9MICO|nr:VOC family protein [Galbitalea soli]NEM90927.1 VOC family protein [Galbitalea soli]NYJ29613.1 hypothetical protein [Galbitalea soli]